MHSVYNTQHKQKVLVCYSGHGLNNEPFGNRTILDHSHTELVRYSDPHCSGIQNKPKTGPLCLVFKWLNHLNIGHLIVGHPDGSEFGVFGVWIPTTV